MLDLEQQMNNLLDLVDQFYDVLGSRHWIFTDQLPVSQVQQLLNTAQSGEAAEGGLIEIIGERIRGLLAAGLVCSGRDAGTPGPDRASAPPLRRRAMGQLCAHAGHRHGRIRQRPRYRSTPRPARPRAGRDGGVG